MVIGRTLNIASADVNVNVDVVRFLGIGSC